MSSEEGEGETEGEGARCSVIQQINSGKSGEDTAAREEEEIDAEEERLTLTYKF